jgi:putative PIN family toxin of toxin-antitoxin system
MAGQIELVVSYDLLLELESVLLRDKFRKRLTVDDVLSYVEYLREHATFVPSRQVERSPGDPMVTDPDDEYLVHLAQDTQADRIVSGDPDFRGLSQADTPREFIDALLYAQQEKLLSQIPEYYRVYYSELRSQLERPEVFAEAVPDWMKGYTRGSFL